LLSKSKKNFGPCINALVFGSSVHEITYVRQRKQQDVKKKYEERKRKEGRTSAAYQPYPDLHQL
jgi:hypothetical protein